MREDYHYCPRCGGRLEIRVQDGRDRQVCSECGYVFYQNPAPAVGVIIVENNEVLLVQRKFEPRKGGWTLPAGFVEYDEFVEDCAVRELKEETNLDVELTGLFGAYSAMDDPRVRVSEIPLADGALQAEMAGQALRDRQYGLLGNYLTRRSNTLIALWDGKITGLKGGTSDVILRYLADGRDLVPNRVAHDESPSEGCGNLLIWLPVRRGAPEGDFTCGPRFIVSNANYNCYWEDSEIPAHILKRWAGFDEYAAEYRSEMGADLSVWGLAEAEGRSPDLATLEAEYSRADQLARVYERRSNGMFALFGVMAGAMGVAFLVYAKLLSEPVFLWIYLGIFVSGFVGFRYTARHHLHARHLAYRALAETYRVQ